MNGKFSSAKFTDACIDLRMAVKDRRQVGGQHLIDRLPFEGTWPSAVPLTLTFGDGPLKLTLYVAGRSNAPVAFAVKSTSPADRAVSNLWCEYRKHQAAAESALTRDDPKLTP